MVWNELSWVPGLAFLKQAVEGLDSGDRLPGFWT